ncbi:lysylphosphatidylglycerol synthase domain-containing protein [Anaeromyxobacter oryzae]|uniref:Radical SAM core domain-containing protein n=1 Tax=Anaeromyxobacter oryzae TaxID=2918170 RepID=A0ABM7WWD5_9BACT|nr:lysylphosphatidylglycerol synthase domain-containing protein [Anaeromyxobacter oryzae]BDG03820.1 hypothetical protein AMOR_28160 [Anaeromyxobacter oryzae]
MRKLAIGERARARLRWLAAIVVLALCVRYLARQVDPGALGRALAGVDYRLVLLMTAAHLSLFLGVKAWRWQVLLDPIQRVSFPRLYAYCLAGCAFTNLLPARAGLAVRAVLVRRDGVPIAGAVSALALEEISNATVLGLLCLPLLLLLHLPGRVRLVLALVTAGAIVALALLGWLALAGRTRASGVLRGLSDGLAVLASPREAGVVLGLTVAMWLVDLGQIALAMTAVAIPPSYAGVALVLLFVNLTNALPATPGQMGLFEAGATAACLIVGATPEQGVAVGVLYHMMQFIPETALGLAVLGRGALARLRSAAPQVELASPGGGGSMISSEHVPSPEVPAEASSAPRLPLADWLHHGPFLAHLVVTRRCNLTCGYCNEYDRTSAPVPFELLEQRLEKLWQLRTWMVCFSGGEPTMHPELARLVRRMTELGIRRRQIITNGFRLGKPLVEALNDAGLTDLQISIDGVSPNATTIKVLDNLRGRLELLARAARFKVVVSAVIGSAPPSEALEVVRFTRGLGLTARIVLLHDGSGRLSLGPDELAAFEEVKRLLGRGGRESGDYRQHLIEHGEAPFACRAGSRYLYVDEFGKVHWCSQTVGLFSKDLAEYGSDELARQFHTPKPCAAQCTVGCARSASAYDGWRRQGPAPGPQTPPEP